MLLHSIQPRNILSFGPDTPPIELRPLNVLIGANGSGKSNLIEVISLLQAAPTDLLRPIREGGGIHDWLWKGGEGVPVAQIDVSVDTAALTAPMHYRLSFTEKARRTELVDELLERGDRTDFYFRTVNGSATLRAGLEMRQLRDDDFNPEQSLLSQRKDPDSYPAVTYVGGLYSRIRFYRDWTIGRKSLPRLPQKADLFNLFLDESSENLALVLSYLGQDPRLKKRLIEKLKLLYPGVDDFVVNVEGGTVQLFLHEGPMSIPANRLSDGTLRYLCLLAILCHPKPPPLICIEEPEIGLHPDLIHVLADLLKEASERTQLIVTTHSDILVDAMTETPEAVLVCEKVDNSTTIRRLDRESLAHWLKDYSLGELWTRGQLGGTRW